MAYAEDSFERRLLEEDPIVLGQVIRWVATVLTSSRFWSLRDEWPDLQQEVLARLIESLRQERFDPTRDFRFYVQGVARYTALQALSRRIQPLSALASGGTVREPRSGAEERVLDRHLVRKVLDSASEECRNLIRWYFFEERSYAQLSDSMAVPVGTVKSRLFRCLEAAYRAISRTGPKRAW